MPISTWKYLFFIFIFGKNGLHAYGQSNPVYLQTFGTGNADPNTIGKALPASTTFFAFSDSTCPPPGSYTIMRRTPVVSCFNGGWILLGRDDSPGNVDFGMMMVVNNTTNANNRLVYKDTVTKSLCAGETYHYGFAVINVSSPGIQCPNGPDFPVLEYKIEDGNGNIIFKDTTRPGVGYAGPPPPFTYKFNHYGFDFVMPGAVNKLALSITLLHSTYVCAEDFAIDNVTIYPVGPAVTIAFNNEPPTTIVKSVCFQQNKTFSISGSVGNYYPNTALQWQQSIDSGITWTDIPGATGTTFTNTFSVPDTFIFRLTASDVGTITNSNCRVASNTLRVNVDGLPKGYTITSNAPVCSGKDLTFNGTGGASYIWNGPNGFYDNVSYAHIYHSKLADSGIYYVQVFSLGGCSTTDSIHVSVIGTDVHAGPDTTICKGRAVVLQASQGTGYAWTPAKGLTATRIRNPMATPDVTTQYNVRVTDSFGCSDTASVTIIVVNKNAVTAGITGTEYMCRLYDSASFHNTSKGSLVKWYWNFGNRQSAITPDAPIQYYNIPSNQNTVIVSLAVADSFGCADTAYHIINVENNCFIAVPNAFTPNGDGNNDYLYPLNAYKATNLHFRVFNRDGLLVFETRDRTRKWNGTAGGVPQSSGVYVWLLDYTDASGKRISLKGTTVLIR
jgi:gliding motility-associated-like protein